jgi:hypothetical protein
VAGDHVTETEAAAAARTYAAAGLAVFPLWWPAGTATGCACPDLNCRSQAKHPLTRSGVNDASRDLTEIVNWWTRWPQANIGLPAQGNGLAILDIDAGSGKHGEESFAKLCAYLDRRGTPLPDTLTQHTGGGGRHMLYAAPDGGIKGVSNAFGTDMPHLDTRGRGGYIVAAPSVHLSGRRYAWKDFLATPVPWPEILTRLIDPPKPKPIQVDRPRAAVTDRYAEAALNSEIEGVRRAGEGGRNTRLNEAAFALGQFIGAGLLDESMVRRELLAAGLSIGLGESEAAKTILSGIKGGRAQPRVVSPR